jgi:nucleotide-binding universal stress UspA family protein
MVRSILIGLDGSSLSDAAVRLAIHWAKKFNALVVGLGIIDEPDIAAVESIPLGAGPYQRRRRDDLLALARGRAEQSLDRFAEQCTQAGVAYKLLEDVGLPSEKILLEAQRYDVIFLGKKTFFEFPPSEQPDQMLGRILKNSPRPVVVTPESAPTHGAILIAYDASLQSARTLAAFEALFVDATAPIHIISAHRDPVEAARHADLAAEYLRFHGIQAHSHAVGHCSDPAAVIIEHAERLGAGLIVMGAYGQPVLREFFFGSVTRTLLKQAATPLFLFH